MRSRRIFLGIKGRSTEVQTHSLMDVFSGGYSCIHCKGHKHFNTNIRPPPPPHTHTHTHLIFPLHGLILSTTIGLFCTEMLSVVFLRFASSFLILSVS